MTTLFSEDVRPISELKNRARELVEQTHRTRRPILVTRRGRGVAVLLDLDEYERLAEQASFIAAIGEGLEAFRAGDLHDDEEAMRILDSFGETC